MASIYVQLTVILLSLIAVLCVLIVYIVRQTLELKKEYETRVQNLTGKKELWIKRHESEPRIEPIS